MVISKAVAAVTLALSRPVEFADRLHGRRERHPPPSDLRLSVTLSDAVAVAHEIAGLDSCGVGCGAETTRVANEVAARLKGDVGYLQVYHDGGPLLAQLVWSLVRHLKPDVVVETGVARGVSSAFILDAMHLNGTGHLWSADLPPIGNGWSRLVGGAVPTAHRDRWTYVRGASRRVLPKIFSSVSPDLFIHDGLHTYQNMAWEYTTARAALRPGGLLVSDDIDDSHAWAELSPSLREQWRLAETDKEGILAVARV